MKMGYRSQVECCIYGEEKDRAQFLLKEAELIQKVIEDWLGWDGALELNKDDRVLTLSVTEVKWYDGYEHIDRWEDVLTAASKEEYNLCWEFIRVGEESDDVDNRRHGNVEGRIYTGTPAIYRDY
jgi:hypothetical protein